MGKGGGGDNLYIRNTLGVYLVDLSFPVPHKSH